MTRRRQYRTCLVIRPALDRAGADSGTGSLLMFRQRKTNLRGLVSDQRLVVRREDEEVRIEPARPETQSVLPACMRNGWHAETCYADGRV